MKKIEIFDPAMCCSTGVCGPSVDPELTKVAYNLGVLEKEGIEAVRYNLSTEPQQFVENPVVRKQLDERGDQALPLVMIDGKIVKAGEYPTAEEFSTWSGIEKAKFSAQPKSLFTILE
ncbi:arsenite efflux transporter metallochaperone ArsD [Halobacillus sp. A5]|uniref:arsenite efflux transporter metallochaperone ArsD n=1 Tax=Halobacillus sp. A5 TaxID=2880263 RepID=UPI0020A6381B|nr:arsenite efflux transporter metallochaperone ArsD [Halobacillus sp. A5]MCP3029411.1 arsenite efflux transporter metallochaperone ArsD [Halobacillus sp. A5]